MRDRGSMVVVVLCTGLAWTAVMTAVLVPFSVGLVERERARVAADAAALAGVAGDRPAAEAVAVANGAVVVHWERDGDDVVVTVEVGGRRATARATDAP